MAANRVVPNSVWREYSPSTDVNSVTGEIRIRDNEKYTAFRSGGGFSAALRWLWPIQLAIKEVTAILRMGDKWQPSDNDRSEILKEYQSYLFIRGIFVNDARQKWSNMFWNTAPPTDEDIYEWLVESQGVTLDEAKAIWNGSQSTDNAPFGVYKKNLPDDYQQYRFLAYDYVKAGWAVGDSFTPLIHIGGVYRYAVYDRLSGKWFAADKFVAIKPDPSGLLAGLLGELGVSL